MKRLVLVVGLLFLAPVSTQALGFFDTLKSGTARR